jgi:hypothetical protein
VTNSPRSKPAPSARSYSCKPKVPHQKHARFARERFREYLEHHDITIPVQSLDMLRERAFRKWKHRNPDALVPSVAEATPEFLAWITVNWIRHQCTEYDQTLRWFSPCMRADMHKLLKLHVLDLIASTYPELAEACSHQSDSVTRDA